jgi:uridylate kinase
MEKTWVISLGGSRIIPGQVDVKFLREFKKLINSHKPTKFVIVTGGGTTARKYIVALRKLGKEPEVLAREGIAITRHHAKFMTKYFGENANDDIPKTLKEVKDMLTKNQVVFCGSLKYKPNNTTDGSAATLAGYLKCPFINLTNVKGLYSTDPTKNKNAKFISKINWTDFNKIVSKIKFKNGQHFVLDQRAAKTILKKKISTYIVGSLKSIDNIIKNKKFTGTLISE